MPNYGDLIFWINNKIFILQNSKDVSAQYKITAYKNVIREIKTMEYKDNIPMSKSNIDALELTSHMANKLNWFRTHSTLINKNQIKSKNIYNFKKELMKIKGIGPKKATQLINNGAAKLSDLKLLKYNKMLNKISIIHMKHNPGSISYKDIQKLEQLMKSIDIKHEIVGSYRRKIPISDDIDILVYDYSKGLDNVLIKFINKLKKLGIYLWIYSKGCEKISTIAKIPNRSRKIKLDLFRVPIKEKATFLLYATGSASFNQRMRIHAKSMPCSSKNQSCKYMLNQHGLYKVFQADKIKELIPIKTEQDVFKYLNMKYISPDMR